MAAVGLRGVGFHDLRRANATAMVLDGVDVKTAQTRLGHSDPRLTLAIYAQATSEGDRTAAERLGQRSRSVRPNRRRCRMADDPTQVSTDLFDDDHSVLDGHQK